MSAPPLPAAFRLIGHGCDFPLAEGTTIIGRSVSASVRLQNQTVSRRHARLDIREGTATLQDLGSLNGTYIWEKRVTTPVQLHNGDTIRLGFATLVFCTVQGTTGLQQEHW